MKTNNALFKPNIQQHLKDTTKFINGYLESSGGQLNASLGSDNEIKIKNEQGTIVKTYEGGRVAKKKLGIDTYV